LNRDVFGPGCENRSPNPNEIKLFKLYVCAIVDLLQESQRHEQLAAEALSFGTELFTGGKCSDFGRLVGVSVCYFVLRVRGVENERHARGAAIACIDREIKKGRNICGDLLCLLADKELDRYSTCYVSCLAVFDVPKNSKDLEKNPANRDKIARNCAEAYISFAKENFKEGVNPPRGLCVCYAARYAIASSSGNDLNIVKTFAKRLIRFADEGKKLDANSTKYAEDYSYAVHERHLSSDLADIYAEACEKGRAIYKGETIMYAAESGIERTETWKAYASLYVFSYEKLKGLDPTGSDKSIADRTDSLTRKNIIEIANTGRAIDALSGIHHTRK
jgi:hypothetical protein